MNLKNYHIYIFIISITLGLSISCRPNRNNLCINKSIFQLDDSLLDNSIATLSKIDKISIDSLNDYEVNYLNLLKIIAQHKSSIKIKSDSSVKNIYEYFKNQHKISPTKLNQINLGRASIYYGIIKQNTNSQDTTIYPLLKKGQELLTAIELPNYYNAITNSNLASIYFSIDSIDVFNQYYEMATSELSEINDFETVALLKIDNILNHLIKRRYDKVLVMLNEMEKENILVNKKIKYAFYNLFATYYATQRDYNNAIKYAHLMKENNLDDLSGINSSKIYFSISKYYSFMDQLDSALLYANHALNYELNSGNKNNDNLHLYFRNIGDIYSKALDYYQSSTAYRRAYYYSLRSVSGLQRKKLKEIERQYTAFLNQSNLEKKAAQKWIFILFEIIIILSLIIIASLFIYKYKLAKLKRRHLELKQETLVKELKQSKGMIDVVSLSLGILPNFIDKINSLSSKIFSSNPILYEEIQTEINSAKLQSRKRLLDLINSDAFIATNPLIKHLENLSNQEKMIFLLLRQKYSTKYISGILNITQSSIRASKVKIKGKIESLEITESEKESLLNDLR